MGLSIRRTARAADSANSSEPLPAPTGRPIPVAFVLGRDAELVDFAGPWGVFEYVALEGRKAAPFELFTVAETAKPLRVSGGLTVVPDYTFANVPAPKVIVVPAMGEPSAGMLAWLKRTSPSTDLTMSVCNGSFVLARAGLLDGKTVTAHHGAYGILSASFPAVTVRRGARFVDDGRISTAGGLTSGIDLALHVVERYFGRDVAEATASQLEYQGQGWKDPDSNAVFASRPASTPDRSVDPVCEMQVDPEVALVETYRGQEYFFCSKSCRSTFDADPARFLSPPDEGDVGPGADGRR
ncbi:MAG: DJ-1/PfpI family protein [Myxococcota bacterium]